VATRESLAHIQIVERSRKLTSQSGEAKAVIAEFTVLNGTKDLVSLALASRACNEASLVVEVSVDVAVSGRGAAEAGDVGAFGLGDGVGSGVLESTAGRNVDLLATRHDNTEGKSSLAASQDGGVTGRAGAGGKVGWAVGRGRAAAEVELSATCGEGLEVDG